jgi:signal transduction histidine kinase
MKDFFKGMILALSILLCAGQAQAADASAKGKATAEQAVAMVNKAAAYLKKNGKEKAFAEFNNPDGQFIDRDLYIYAFLTNGDGIERANGANLKLVGKNVLEMKDADGQYLIKNILAVADNPAGEAWLEYKWVNPVTHAIDKKKAFVKKVGDVLLGCGIYE